MRSDLPNWLVLYLAAAYVSVGRIAVARDEDVTVDARVRMEDVSDYSRLFLSDVKTLPVMTTGDFTYRYELDEPPDDDVVMNIARKRMEETPEKMETSKKELIDLLKKNRRLNAPVDNDAWLIRFLRMRKYNAAMTYDLIKGYYKFKANNRYILNGLLPSKERKVAESNIFTILPYRDQLGRRVILCDIAKWKPDSHSLIEVWRLAIVLLEINAYEPRTQMAGAVFIFDMKGLTMRHIGLLVNPMTAMRLVSWFLSPPVRIREIHVVNQPSIFRILYRFFKPFKLCTTDYYFHGYDMKSLHKYVTPTSLPDIYGGTYKMPHFSGNQWEAYLKTMDDEYAKIDSYGFKRGRKT